MSQAVLKRWTTDAFFAWQEGQPDRYELVDGVPVRMMAGASNRHDTIVVNLLGELRNQLRGGPCRPFTGDGAVEAFPGQIRRPDAGVDCGPRDPDGFKASSPRVVIEVLSPSTRDSDTLFKIAEYRALDSLDTILIIEPNAPEVVAWSRGADRTWSERRTAGLEGSVELPSVGVTLGLADLYEDVVFPSTPPRLSL